MWLQIIFNTTIVCLSCSHKKHSYINFEIKQNIFVQVKLNLLTAFRLHVRTLTHIHTYAYTHIYRISIIESALSSPGVFLTSAFTEIRHEPDS